MSIYEYQEPSALQKIAIRKTAGGGTRAFLYAREGLPQSAADGIREALEAAHLSCVPSEVDGQHCLEVRGCRNVKAVEDALVPKGYLKGHGLEDKSGREKFSLRDKFRDNMVTIYGVLNVIADVGIITYGRMKQKLSPEKKMWEDTASGIAYSAGSLTFTFFGRGDKSDFQARDIAKKLKGELAAKGIDLPEDSAAASFANSPRNQATSKKLGGFLTKYGAESGNIATGTAGAFILKGALKSDKQGTKLMDSVLGATTLASGYGAALVKEKAPDPENPPTGTFGKIKQWIQERPNRLAGYGYMASTVMHGTESIRHYANAEKEHPGQGDYARKAYAMRGSFSALNLISEFVLARASKGHGTGVKGNSTIEDTALAIVADAVVRQPQAARDGLIKELGQKFLANPDVLGGNSDALEAMLYERVHRLENNPWARKAGQDNAKQASALGGSSETRGAWADNKVQKLLSDTHRAPENYVASVDKSRSAALERIP